MKSVLIRMPEENYEALKVAALQQRRSLNSQIVAMLSWLAPPMGTEPSTASVIPTIVAVEDERAATALQAHEEMVEEVSADWTPICTCAPAEMRKGKHNKHCPAKG